jgi:pimeloyl-ACP methyl ester carboxylesterase
MFPADDGTRLAVHREGSGEPVIALPGGPMQSSAYLSGLPVPGELIRLDLRGTGDSDVPDDPGTYRCDRQVPDVDALRRHLGRDRIDLLGHSAGASLAVTYAARHPDRIRRLVLLNPSPFTVGVTVTDADRREVAETRRGEPWFGPAYAAFERIWAGTATGADWAAIEPFRHGRRTADLPADQNEAAAAEYYAGGAVDPAATRAALSRLDAPVLLVSGAADVSLPPVRAAEFAALFPRAELALQPGGGHYPWADDRDWLAATLAAFLSRP